MRRDANRGKERADSGGDQRDQECNEIGDIDLRMQISCHRRHRRHDDDEDQRQDGKKHGERDFVWCLLPFGAFHEVDNAIEKRTAGIGRDANLQPVRNNGGSGGDRREHIGARLLQDRRRFAGDGGFVDVSYPLDDIAIRRHNVVLLHPDKIALMEFGGRHLLGAAILEQTHADKVGSGLPQRRGFCLAAPFGKSLRIIGKPNSQRRAPQ